MRLPGTEGVKRAVEARLGIGMVSGYSVENECLTGVLRRVPVEDFQIVRTMNLVYRAQKYFSPVGARLREFAKSFGAPRDDPGNGRQGRRRTIAERGMASIRRRGFSPFNCGRFVSGRE